MAAVALWPLVGIAAAIGGIFLLRKAWRKRFNAMLEILGGSLLVLCSIVAWAQTSGADKGAALGVIVVMFIGGLAVLITTLRSPKRDKKEARQLPKRESKSEPVGRAICLQRIYHGLLIFLITGLAAVSISTGLFMVLQGMGMEHSANLTLIAFLCSILWASLAVFAGLQQALLRKSLIILGMVAAPAAAMALIY